MFPTLSICLFAGAGLGLSACGGNSESSPPPPPGTTTLLTPEGTEEIDCVQDPDQIGCVDQRSDRGDCGPSADFDVVLNADGSVVDIICYPATDEGNADLIQVDDASNVEAGNNDVIVLDGVIDGADIEGDLDIEANGVSVVGEGPDVSIISGDLNVDKNNLAVRGVRIEGSVLLGALEDGSTGNNPAFVFCVVEGDVIIEGNNVTFAGCDIFGNVEVTGNNAVLIQNRIQGDLVVTGDNTECDGNVARATWLLFWDHELHPSLPRALAQEGQLEGQITEVPIWQPSGGERFLLLSTLGSISATTERIRLFQREARGASGTRLFGRPAREPRAG